MTDPAARLEIVRPAVPSISTVPVLGESWSNETWLTDHSVLRVCWRGDRKRLAREAMLLESLPASVPHATVMAAGSTEGLTWMVARRLAGERLELAWPRLSAQQRQNAVISFAGALKALHRWKPPTAVRQQLRPAPLAAPIASDDVIGAAIVPLPVPRLVLLLPGLKHSRA